MRTLQLLARAGLTGLVLLGAPLSSEAQSPRSFEASRSWRDSMPMQVRVSYDAGYLGVRSGAPRTLYEVRLRYDAAGSAPVYSYSPDIRALHVGSKDLTGHFSGPRTHGSDSLQVALSNGTPLDLAIELGAAAANVDLSGLRLRHLKLESGASEATVRFDSVNAERMPLLDLQAGVAKLTVRGLGNANADEVRVRAGVGAVDLDFSGAWTHDAELTLDVAVGGAVLRVPATVGMRMELTKVFAKVEVPAGMREVDGAWQSANWATATRRLRIRAHTTMGSVRIEQP